jgi:hypothetical protein
LLESCRKGLLSIPERFHELGPELLTRAVAIMVPGLTPIDGELHDSVQHTWLSINGHKHTYYVIDLFPKYHLPGPLLVNVFEFRKQGWYKPNLASTRERDEKFSSLVNEVHEATEVARRFLSMP